MAASALDLLGGALNNIDNYNDEKYYFYCYRFAVWGLGLYLSFCPGLSWIAFRLSSLPMAHMKVLWLMSLASQALGLSAQQWVAIGSAETLPSQMGLGSIEGSVTSAVCPLVHDCKGLVI